MRIAPGLRFSSFKKSWESSKLELAIASIQSGKSKDREINGQFPLFGSTGVIGYTNKPEYSGKSILIARVGANAGSKYAVEGEYSVTDNTLILRLKEGFSYEFFSDLLEHKKLNKLTFGSGQPLVTGGLLKQIEVNYPEENEQQKIAAFISLIDQKISLLTKKHEFLIQYKKGVMQKIFNQEIRFKDKSGKDFLEWQSLTFDDVCMVNMGQSPESSSYNEESIGMPLIQGNADISYHLTVPRIWTSRPTKTCDSGDLILTVRAPVGAVGKSTTRACIGRGVCSISPKENTSRDFLYQLLLWFESFKWRSIEQGSTFTAISGGDIRGLKAEFPCLEEQVEIAKFLDSLDLKISLVKSKLELTKQYKQGLLHQMFI